MYNNKLIEVCPYCGSETFKQRTIDKIGYICEYEVLCEKCKKRVIYWHHGYYENNHYINPEYKSRLIKTNKNN